MDQAINYVANDPRFQYLWHDEEFIEKLYDDNKFCDAVDALMAEIRDIEHKEKADFFHKFVHHEYAREQREYVRDILLAESPKFRLRARGATIMSDSNVNEDITNESTSELGTPLSNGGEKLHPSPSRVASQSGHHSTNSSLFPGSGSTVTQYFVTNEHNGSKYSDGTFYERPYLKIYEESLKGNKHHLHHHHSSRYKFGEIDCSFKIIHPNHHKKSKYREAEKDNNKWYFRLPSVHPGEKSQWVQWKWSRKFKEYGFGNKKRGYWKLIGGKPESVMNEEGMAANGHVDVPIDIEMERMDPEQILEKKEKERKKRKEKQIPIRHLNYVLGLMRLYLKWSYENCDEARSKESQTAWIYEKVAHAFVWTGNC